MNPFFPLLSCLSSSSWVSILDQNTAADVSSIISTLRTQILNNHTLHLQPTTNNKEAKRHPKGCNTIQGKNENTTMTSTKEKTDDDRAGLKFGAETAYDSDSEYVAALPTDQEEQMLRAGEDVKAKEKIEYLDEGRASNHPSTLAATNKASQEVSAVSLFSLVVNGLIRRVRNERIMNKFLLTGFFVASPILIF
jgi:hypothetical protein